MKAYKTLAAGLVLALILCGCQSIPAEDAAPAPEAPPQDQPDEPRTLMGVVASADGDNFTVRDEQGGLYTFSLSSLPEVTAPYGVMAGMTAVLTYAGEIAGQSETLPDLLSAEITPPADMKARLDTLAGMTLEQKVGQLFIARCPESGAADKAKQYALGGYILFGRDFEDETPGSIRQTITLWQENAAVPMLIGVDEEGGTVNRVSRSSVFRESPFLSPRQLYEQGGLEAVAADTEEKSQLLLSLGINMNFAPVCDVTTSGDSFMAERTFGQGAEQTADYVKTVVSVMSREGIGAVLKHFPGYGDNADTHTGSALDERDAETFYQSDFLPFQAGIDAGAGAVLVCHNVVAAFDADSPASLSAEVHRVLREELGFDGVIVTDDLAMSAISGAMGDEQAAIAAIQAGNDLLCTTAFETQIPAVIQAVRDGSITEERLDQSVLRVLKYKQDIGLLS